MAIEEWLQNESKSDVNKNQVDAVNRRDNHTHKNRSNTSGNNGNNNKNNNNNSSKNSK